MVLTKERLKEVLSYDSKTGVFTWRVSNSNRCPKGSVAGSDRGGGYYKIAIDGRKYYAHRLAVLYMTGRWPERFVDHKDGNPSNNRWSNLRLADDYQNSGNRRVQSNNSSGFKGIAQVKNRWAAYIRRDGKTRYIGLFPTPEEAHAAYVEAAVEQFGEFARAS